MHYDHYYGWVCRSPRISPSAISMSTSETSLREEDSDIFAPGGTPSKQSQGSGSPPAAFASTSTTAAAAAAAAGAAEPAAVTQPPVASAGAGPTTDASVAPAGAPANQAASNSGWSHNPGLCMSHDHDHHCASQASSPGQLTHVEQVMELSRCRQHLSCHLVPPSHCKQSQYTTRFDMWNAGPHLGTQRCNSLLHSYVWLLSAQ